MAVLRKKEKKETPRISMSSLPDVIFLLIFFFMVSTTMRQVDLLVRFTLPVASEAQKLEKKSLVSYIQIGPPTDVRRYGTTPRIQLNDAFRGMGDIGAFVVSEKEKLGEVRGHYLSVSLKADANLHMGIISDVKTELRRAGQNKLIYAAEIYAKH
ncbi:MAG: biopolymer transporter ExbD [Rikenellaceae bacterium]|nr:biopolymer transporter ExbD [Rikenellaceae bacterium]MCL2692550.1 biopolymer transporter ExbD [Rikenellaceae bacterium]